MARYVSLALAAVSAGALMLGFAAPAAASGFYIQEQSVRGLGRAYSGETADQGPASLWWNAASIAQTEGLEIDSGFHAVLPESTLRNRGNSAIILPFQQPTQVGGDPRQLNALETGVVPNFDVAYRLNEHVALGFALSAPFEFTTKYKPDSFIRYDAVTSKLFSVDMQPTVAVHVNRFLDVGAGLDAQYIKATLTQALPNVTPGDTDGENRLKGDGWDFGFTAGLQLHPTDRLTLGANYRSAIDHTLDGSVKNSGLLDFLAFANGRAPGSAAFSTPYMIDLGARYILNDHWTLDAQVEELGWSEFNNIVVKSSLVNATVPEHYHDTTKGAVGVEYTLNPKLTFRTGVQYDPTPTPDGSRSARVPDGDRYLFAFGATARPTPKLSLDAAVSYVTLIRAFVNNNPQAGTGIPVPVLYNAVSTGSAFILSAGARMKF